ncbi:UNVERIFIED_CONTAM: hypothetical protein Sindi_0063700 [Sesamum indicum]
MLLETALGRLSKSPRGTPSSNESKGKHPASLSLEATPRGSSKKARMSSLEDKHLLSPMPQEELERIGASYLLKEEKVERLGAENAKLKKAKKESTNRCQQLEKDLKKFQKELAGHKAALKKATVVSLILIMIHIIWKAIGPAVSRNSRKHG